MRPRCTYLVLAALLLTAACRDDGDGKGDPCERAAAAKQEAADAYCAPLALDCCYCSCWGTTGHYDIEAFLTNGSCVCIAPPVDTDTSDDACEDETLEQAEECLDHIDECTASYVAQKQLACDSTPFPG